VFFKITKNLGVPHVFECLRLTQKLGHFFTDWCSNESSNQ